MELPSLQDLRDKEKVPSTQKNMPLKEIPWVLKIFMSSVVFD